MPVHPLIAARFPLIRSLPPDVRLQATEEAERAFFAFGQPFGAYALPAVRMEDRAVDGPHGPIPVRVYRPLVGAAGGAGGPGVLWLHGGGFVAGELDMPEAHVVAAELAARVGAVVVSVDYRLATETVKYPVPLDDVDAAWRWFQGAAAELGAELGRLAIGGASAGGNLAVAATLRARDAGRPLPAAMLLAYPALHFPVPALADDLAAEMRELPPVLRFTPDVVAHITRSYLGRLTDIPSHLMPGLADLTGLPATRVVLSEYDDLRSSGELFAVQLAEAGVPVEATVAEGMLHGHLNQPPVAELPEIGRSIDFLASALG